MTALKNFLLGAITITVLMFLLRGTLCKWLCPPCETKTPNPTIEFKVQNNPNANFGVIAHPVDGSASAKLRIFDHGGTEVGNGSLTFNTPFPVTVPVTAQRPLQLHFDYLSASNQSVAVDSIIIDDRNTGGNPPMEILEGAVVGGQNPCPNTSTQVSVVASPGGQKFTWQVGKMYKIKLTPNGGSAKEIMMTTELNNQTGCYKLILWEDGKYACLTNTDMENSASTEMEIEVTSSILALLNANDSCDGQTAREVFINFVGGSGTVEVKSN